MVAALILTDFFDVTVLPPPEHIKLIRSSPDTILVTWDEPKLPVAGYRVYYNMFELQKMDLWQKKYVGPYTVTELTELDSVSVYAVRIQARSVDGRYGNLSEAVVCPVGTSRKLMKHHLGDEGKINGGIDLRYV